MLSAMSESIGIPEGLDPSRLVSGWTGASVRREAESLYQQARSRGWHDSIRSMLIGSPHHMLKLDRTARPAYDGGLQTVPIKQICGSENRYSDFDAQFHPLESRTRDRWISIAAARLMDTPLTPVELIQVGDIYYVRDGHHRISVARALGEEYIEAHVITWAK